MKKIIMFLTVFVSTIMMTSAIYACDDSNHAHDMDNAIESGTVIIDENGNYNLDGLDLDMFPESVKNNLDKFVKDLEIVKEIGEMPARRNACCPYYNGYVYTKEVFEWSSFYGRYTGIWTLIYCSRCDTRIASYYSYYV